MDSRPIVNTSNAVSQLEKMFDALNKEYFNGALPDVVFILKTYTHKRTKNLSKQTDIDGAVVLGQKKHTINMSYSRLDLPLHYTAATLLHEMCHLYNMCNGIKDCSGNGNAYHNKRFKETAETHGLEVEHSKKYGWIMTKPSKELVEFIYKEKFKPFSIACDSSDYEVNDDNWRYYPTGNDKPFIRKPSSTRKYICPCCGMSVRATKMVAINCADCDVRMILDNAYMSYAI